MKKHSKILSVINKYFKGLSTQKTSDGFTLVELLVAMSITTIVVGLTGFGVVAITQNTNKAKIETERRVELNRALDFIADEVRQAKPIATNASANLATVASDFSLTFDTPVKTRVPVLTLQIPGVAQRVIYYIAPKSTNSVWLGPNVVYRWGPNFTDDGEYSNPTSPSSWTYEPLADLFVNTAPSSTPSCPGWSLNPPSGSITGFYACVDPNGRIADIHLRGKLTDTYGTSRPPFEVSTKAFARPDTPTFATGPGGGGPGPGGTVTITEPSTAYFEILGGSITCGAGGAVLPTTTTIKVTPPGGSMTSTVVNSSTKALNLPPAVAGTKITVAGGLNGCGIVNRSFDSEADKGSASTTQQVWTLRNGDTPPRFAPLSGQPNIDTFLTKYLDANGKVKLAENQVIYLFELGATDPTSTAYDMQDLVVLATIAPS